VIEQAKGAIIGRLRCDADDAFLALRETSQLRNVKLRELAVALVEYLGLGGTPPRLEAPAVDDAARGRSAYGDRDPENVRLDLERGLPRAGLPSRARRRERPLPGG
jgi:hypothetical protein